MSGRAASILASRRDELNARFARKGRAIDPSAMQRYLARTAIPIVDAWTTNGADALLVALFDLGLLGLPSGLVGATEPTPFEAALVRGAPTLGAHLDDLPARTLRVLGNGFAKLARELGEAAALRWLDGIVAIAPGCDGHEALLEVGIVGAWQAGLAEARDVALDHLAKLAPATRRQLFAEGEPSREPARRFCRPGALAPSLGPLHVVAALGGFVGFGGPFTAPPRARAVGDRLFATDGVATVELHADVHGARWTPAAWAHADAHAMGDDASITTSSDGRVAVGPLELVDETLRGANGAAAAAGMVAVTLVDSHKVFVLGRTEAP